MIKLPFKYVIAFLLLILCALLSIQIGAAQLSSSEVFSCLIGNCKQDLHEILIFELRLPRLFAAIIAGAGLSIAGALLQNITRNPLAEPYLFGVMSGAALGVTVAQILLPKLDFIIPITESGMTFTLPFFAFIGAAFAMLLVFSFAARFSFARIEIFLLSGVAVTFMLSSISQFLMYLNDPYANNRIVFWMMGSLTRITYQDLALMLPSLIASLFLILFLQHKLDAFLLSDEDAHHLGVNVKRTRLLVLMICAGLTASIVAFCGGIGFVGLMIPHIARRIFGVTILKLTTGSLILGACFLTLVDIVARSVLPGQELPLGVITSALGSFFFFIILYKKNIQ